MTLKFVIKCVLVVILAISSIQMFKVTKTRAATTAAVLRSGALLAGQGGPCSQGSGILFGSYAQRCSLLPHVSISPEPACFTPLKSQPRLGI